jgi:hypothetical protein
VEAVTFEEELASWRRAADADEAQFRKVEDPEIAYYARFREVFRHEPTLLAWLDEPQPIEDRIRHTREGRAAGRWERAESSTYQLVMQEAAWTEAAPCDQAQTALAALRDEVVDLHLEARGALVEVGRVAPVLCDGSGRNCIMPRCPR